MDFWRACGRLAARAARIDGSPKTLPTRLAGQVHGSRPRPCLTRLEVPFALGWLETWFPRRPRSCRRRMKARAIPLHIWKRTTGGCSAVRTSQHGRRALFVAGLPADGIEPDPPHFAALDALALLILTQFPSCPGNVLAHEVDRVVPLVPRTVFHRRHWKPGFQARCAAGELAGLAYPRAAVRGSRKPVRLADCDASRQLLIRVP